MLVELVAQGNTRRTSLSRQATGEAMFGGGIRGSCGRHGKGSVTYVIEIANQYLAFWTEAVGGRCGGH